MSEYNLYNLSKESIERLEKLTAFDMAVHIAVCTLCEAGVENFTTSQVLEVMKGNGTRFPKITDRLFFKVGAMTGEPKPCKSCSVCGSEPHYWVGLGDLAKDDLSEVEVNVICPICLKRTRFMAPSEITIKQLDEIVVEVWNEQIGESNV